MAKLEFNSKEDELQPLNEGKKSCEEADLDINEFEFRVQISDKEMCAADDVFFKGKLLPLRSISSRSTSFHDHHHHHQQHQKRHDQLFISSHESSKCNSRSDSMDRFSYCRSISNSSSTSKSCSCLVSEPSRRSVSNQVHFHRGHPSPSPQIFTSDNNNKSTKKKIVSWLGMFRAGHVKTPETELEDLKQYRRTSVRENFDNKDKMLKKIKKEYFGFRGCKCSNESIETVSSRILITKMKKKKIMNNENEDYHGLIRNRYSTC